MTPDEYAYQLHRIAWIRTLCALFETEHDWRNDADPSATWEMLGECRALAGEMADKLGPPPEAPPSSEDWSAIPF